MQSYRSSAVTALAIAAGLAIGIATPAAAGPREDQLAAWSAQAKVDNPAFAGFSAARGETLFRTTHGGGKPETPACTTCHGNDPRQGGQTRAGKAIDPLAVSAAPRRYTDPETVEKWFGRNCASVLGRACTAQEKGDFVTYMMGQ